MKSKAELKRRRKGGSDFDSSFVDEEKLRRMLKKLKKIKKEDSDEESGLKSKNKLDVTPSKIHDILGDIASKLVFAQEVDFLFKVSFLTLFASTMGIVIGLRGQICLDVVRRLREDCVIYEIDWCGYIHSFLKDSKLPDKRTMQYLGPFTFLILLYLDSIKFDRFLVVRTRPAIKGWTSTLMRQRQDLETKEHMIGCLELHDEWTKSEHQETEGFTRVSSFDSK
ncbi:hypothetical protein Tco_1073200 [Tanacetum coccineum]